MPKTSDSKTLLVGISGVSSSGKTTLSRLLRDIYPHTFILHEDDFYKPDAEIPIKNGVADWDCLDSLDLPALQSALSYIKTHARLPDNLVSKEDLNSVGSVDVDASVVDALKDEAQGLKGVGDVTVAIVDGFLLFSEQMRNVRELFDIKLFLKTDYATAKKRREARNGYVTIEGFWEDPPGYVDEVVWPNYVTEHAFLFRNEDVDDEVKADLCAKLGIAAMPKNAQDDMTECVRWAYGELKEALRTKEG